MPEAILTILKFCFLGLLYLFVVRVLRAVESEMSLGRGTGSVRLRLRGRGDAADGGKAYQLRMVEPPTAQVFPLSEEVTIGRAPGCSVALADDTFVSQLHARVYVRDGQPFVEDLGSTNGTFLNQSRLTKTMRLRRGDRLQIGQTVLEVSA
ncbi:MAG: FHA domain-containing protein [Acidimicrobiia bacterium]